MGTDRSLHGRQGAMRNVDVAVIGGGSAGAGLAAMAAPHARIAILEMEERPGYHTTGRSAAFYAETYGGAAVQPLTTASKGFFENPPPGFADAPLVGPRGGLHMAEAAHLPLLAQMDREFAQSGVALRPLDRADMEEMLPGLGDRKSTRLPVTNAHLVCRLLLEKKKKQAQYAIARLISTH